MGPEAPYKGPDKHSRTDPEHIKAGSQKRRAVAQRRAKNGNTSQDAVNGL